MLSINTIARVNVNTVRTTETPSSFDTGLLLVEDSLFTDTRRLQSCGSAAVAGAVLSSLGFGPESEPYQAAQKYFAASPAPGRLLISCHPASEDLSGALDAVLDRTAGFYGVLPCGTYSPSEWAAFADHAGAISQPVMIFVPVTGTASAAAAADGILDRLCRGRCRRALPFFCASLPDCAALMGTAMGLELAHRDSAFSLCYKTVSGVEPPDLSQQKVNAIKELNGNVYVARGYTHLLLENGTVSSGQRYDEILYADRIAADLQNAAVSLLTENPDRMPQTDDSTAQFINRFSSILMGYTDRGILASAVWRGADTGPLKAGEVIENGFLLWADSYDSQSDADRAAHRAVPVQAALTLAGSIESIVMTVNVQQ